MKRPGPAVVVDKKEKSLAKNKQITGEQVSKKENIRRRRGEMTLAKKNQ
jgi:hypothetical protein